MLTQLLILFACLFAIVWGECSPTQTQDCLMAAHYKLGKAVPGLPGPISDAICVNIQEQVNCIKSSNFDCFAPNKKAADFFDELQEKLETRDDNATYKSCMNNKNFPQKFMFGATGSNKCTFLDYHIRLYPQMQECIGTHLYSWEKQIVGSKISKDSNNVFTKLVCDAHKKILVSCRDGLRKKCFSRKMAEKVNQIEDKMFYQVYESIIRRKVMPNFKLEGYCF